MGKVKKELTKATAELAKEYDELMAKMNAENLSRSEEEASATHQRLHELKNNYDWFNVEFTDPETGKKGLKDVTGKILVPALYDGFTEYHSYIYSPQFPVAAMKDGKCGIVACDGSGKVFSEFMYDHAENMFGSSLFLAKWGGEKERFGVVAINGEVICPNILTSYSQPANCIADITSGDKYGVIDVETYQCVLPEYDDIEVDCEGPVIFCKGDQRGYVTDKGEFITIDQYENDEKYCDANLVSTWIPDL